VARVGKLESDVQAKDTYFGCQLQKMFLVKFRWGRVLHFLLHFQSATFFTDGLTHMGGRGGGRSENDIFSAWDHNFCYTRSCTEKKILPKSANWDLFKSALCRMWRKKKPKKNWKTFQKENVLKFFFDNFRKISRVKFCCKVLISPKTQSGPKNSSRFQSYDPRVKIGQMASHDFQIPRVKWSATKYEKVPKKTQQIVCPSSEKMKTRASLHQSMLLTRTLDWCHETAQLAIFHEV